MLLICPHCRAPIERAELRLQEEVVCPACGSSFHLEGESTTAGTHAHAQRFGRFDLLDVVGRGAFGTVYRAHDSTMDRVVAVKVPRAGSLPEGAELERFLREARSAGQLRHPAIVPVHEVGEIAGTPYLVSEFVQGVTLADLIQARRPTAGDAARLVVAMADALGYAHAQGIVHRDIKPSNILIDQHGLPHLTDFGLARREVGEVTMTRDGQVLGTPAYMSPEQARGEGHTVDGRSDVYSLGVVLYQLLTGELPFRGNTRMLLHQVLTDDPRTPRSLNDTIPRDLETVCLKAMAKEPGRRYPTAAAFADDLRRFLQGEPILARPTGRLERFARRCRRNPIVAGLTAALVVVAVAGLGAFGWQYTEALGQRDKALEQQGIAERNEEDAKDRANDLAAALGKLGAAEKVARDTAAREGEARQAESRAKDEAERRYQQARAALFNSHLVRVRSLLERNPFLAREALEDTAAFPLDQRDFSWDYYRAMVQPTRTTLTSEPCQMLAFTPGGLLATVTRDGAVELREPGVAAVKAVLRGPEGTAEALVFSADGRRVAVEVKLREVPADGKPYAVTVWDVASGKQVFALGLSADEGPATVALSKDGRLLAAGQSGESYVPQKHGKRDVQVWDLDANQSRGRFPGPMGRVQALAFSPDGNTLLAGGGRGELDGDDDWSEQRLKGAKGGEVVVYRIADRQELHRLTAHFDSVNHVAFSPDGRTFYSAEDNTFVSGGKPANLVPHLRAWDLATGKERFHVPIAPPGSEFKKTPDRAVAASSDGKLLAVITARSLDLLDAGSGRLLRSIPPWKYHPSGNVLQFTPDNKSLLAAFHHELAVFDVATGEERNRLRFRGPSDTSQNDHLAVSPDGKALVVQLQVTYGPAGPDQPPEVVHYRLGSSAADGDWLKATLDLPPGPEKHLVIEFAPTGRTLAVGSGDRRPLGHDDFQGGLCFCGVEGLGVPGQGNPRMPGVVRLLDLASGWEKARLVHPGTVTAVAFTPDERRLAVGCTRADAKGRLTGEVHFWDLATASRVRVLRGFPGEVNRVALSPDGGRVAAGSEGGEDDYQQPVRGEVRAWDVATGQEVATFQTVNRVYCLAFTPDGKHLVVGSGRLDRMAAIWYQNLTPTQGELTVWDLAARRSRYRRQAHRAGIRAVAFAADGRLATGSSDGTVKLWDFAAGEEVLHLPAHPGPVKAVAFGADPQELVTAGPDGVKVWNLATKQPRLTLPDAQDVHRLERTTAPASLRVHDLRTRLPTNAVTATVASITAHPHPARLPNTGGKAELSSDGKTLVTSTAVPFGSLTPQPDVISMWDVASAELRGTLTGHKLQLARVVFGPDGRTLATVTAQTTMWSPPPGQRVRLPASEIKLWDVARVAEVATLTGHEGVVQDFAFAPDGLAVAAALAVSEYTSGTQQPFPVNGEVLLWDAATGKIRRRFEGHRTNVQAVWFLDGGRGLAALSTTGLPEDASKADVHVWEVETGKLLRSFPAAALPMDWRGAPVRVGRMASADGRWLASGSNGAARLVDVGTEQERFRAPARPGLPAQVELLAEGKIARVVAGQEVVYWDVANRKRLALTTRPDQHCPLANDGRSALRAGVGEEVELVDVETNRARAKIAATPYSASFTPDGRRVVVNAVGNFRIYHADTGKEALRPDGMTNFSATSPDGRAVLGLAGNDAVLWDAETGKARARLPAGCDWYNSAFSPDGKRFALSRRMPATQQGSISPVGLVTIDVASGRVVSEWWRTAGTPADVGAALAAGVGGPWPGISVWAAVGRTPPLAGVEKPEFAPDGNTLAATVSDGQPSQASIVLFDARTGGEVARFEPRLSSNILRFSPDGNTLLVTNSLDHGKGNFSFPRPPSPPVDANAVRQRHDAVLWSVATRRVIATLRDLPGPVSLSPDGKYLVSEAPSPGKPTSVMWWDVATGRPCGHLTAVSGRVLVAPDQTLFAPVPGGVRRYALADGKETRYYPGVGQPVWVADGGAKLVSVELGGLTEWDTTTGVSTVLHPISSWVETQVSADGKFVLARYQDALIVYDAATGRARASRGEVTSATLSGPTTVTLRTEGGQREWDFVTGTERKDGPDDTVSASTTYQRTADGRHWIVARPTQTEIHPVRPQAVVPKEDPAALRGAIELANQGKIEEAHAAFRALCKTDAGNVWALVALGKRLLERKQYPLAEKVLAEALRVQPNHVEAQHGLARLAAARGHDAEAVKLYRALVAAHPEQAEAWHELGVVLGRLGQPEEALTARREAARCCLYYARPAAEARAAEAVAKATGGTLGAPNHRLYSLELGSTLFSQGQLSEAADQLRLAIRRHPQLDGAYNDLGCALRDLGQYDEAIRAYEQCVKLAPANFRPYRNLGLIYLDQQLPEKALPLLEKALELSLDVAENHGNLGRAYLHAGKPAAARKAFERWRDVLAKQKAPTKDADEWVRWSIRAGELTARSTTVEGQTAVPKDNAERLEFARFCSERSYFAAAARYYRDAFAADAKLPADLKASTGYNAASAAALAGCGRGKDAAQLDPAARAVWRKQALDWLRADLNHRATCLGTPEEAFALNHLAWWLRDPDLAGVRDEAIGRLPADEREAWSKLWEDVTRLRLRVEK